MALLEPGHPRDHGDPLGFCEKCIRTRWLAEVKSVDERGNPRGVCRSCKREEEEEED